MKSLNNSEYVKRHCLDYKNWIYLNIMWLLDIYLKIHVSAVRFCPKPPCKK